MLRRWLGQEGPDAPGPEPPAFDALIDIDPGQLAPGVDSATAAAAVRDAVQRLPGAGWISTACHPGPPHSALVQASIYPAGSSVPDAGGHWLRVQAQVEDTARAAILQTQPSIPAPLADTWDQPPELAAAPAGFADGQAFNLAQLEALEQLSLLAQAQQATPRALPDPPVAPPDAVLLARLLGFVLPADALPSAHAAVARFGSFAAVLAAPEAELRKQPGLGTHSIAAIKLVHAAALRLARAGVMHQPVLDNWDRLLAYLSAALAREKVEQFRILFLDGTGRLRADEAQATGTVNHTPVYPREVVRRALELKAVSLILVHNHPSGDPAPSRADIEMTRQIQDATGVLSIAIQDHIIVGNGRWLSFREEGLLS